ncbi:hypothetical protein PtB15_15B505 [Puccinia triticina]|nr:hypothetical protein PtB15_15B505 [Puccinia triticina]
MSTATCIPADSSRPASSASGACSHRQTISSRNTLRLSLNLDPPSQPAPAAPGLAFLRPIHAALAFLLHILYQLLHRCLLRPPPAPLSASTTPLNSALPAALSHLLLAHRQPHKPRPASQPLRSAHQHPPSNNLSAILITTNSELNPLSLQLALDFAAIGYHVFLQVSSHSQLTQVILGWQRLKSTLNKPHPQPIKPQPPSLLSLLYLHLFSGIPFHHQASKHHQPTIGSLIPLLYLSHDLPQRLEAISTINAYIHENAIDMLTLINIIDPHRIRKSYPIFYNSPLSPTFSINRNNPASASSSSPSISCPRPLAGITSPSAASEQLPSNLHSPSTPRSLPASSSTGSSNHEIYNHQPLPLSISSENYLFDVFGDILLGPLNTTQDLLLLLKDHRGRVINIWDAHRHPQSALIKIMLNGFQRTTKVLKDELEPLQIPVSIIYKPPGNNNKSNFRARTAQSTVTRDSRSLLSEASDPDLLHVFTKQTAEMIRRQDQLTATFSDQTTTRASFELVRSVLETNYPCPVYPIGIRDLGDLLANLSGLDRAFSSLERLLAI